MNKYFGKKINILFDQEAYPEMGGMGEETCHKDQTLFKCPIYFKINCFYCQTNAPFQPEVYSPPESGSSRRGQKHKKTYIDITTYRLNMPRGMFSKNPSYRKAKYLLKCVNSSTLLTPQLCTVSCFVNT